MNFCFIPYIPSFKSFVNHLHVIKEWSTKTGGCLNTLSEISCNHVMCYCRCVRRKICRSKCCQNSWPIQQTILMVKTAFILTSIWVMSRKWLMFVHCTQQSPYLSSHKWNCYNCNGKSMWTFQCNESKAEPRLQTPTVEFPLWILHFPLKKSENIYSHTSLTPLQLCCYNMHHHHVHQFTTNVLAWNGSNPDITTLNVKPFQVSARRIATVVQCHSVKSMRCYVPWICLI